MEEKTVWSGTSSQLINFGVFLVSGIIFALLLVLLIQFWPTLSEIGTLALAPAFVILLSPLAFALVKVLLVKALRYEITNERIKITTGIFSKKTTTLELYRVKDYTLKEPFFYRLFRLGNIVILTSDHTTPQLLMKAIPSAKRLMDEIRTHVEARRDLKRVREVDFDGAGAPGDGPG